MGCAVNEAKAAEYQKRTDECREAAARTKGRAARKMLFGMAEHWQLLADSERQHAQRYAKKRPHGGEDR